MSGLIVILLMVLVMPFLFKVIERNLEVFLFLMGLAAVLTTQILNYSLMLKALKEPIIITCAVIVAGLLFKWFQAAIEGLINKLSLLIPLRLFLALVVIILGLLSSIITAMIAAIVLITITSTLNLDRKSEIHVVILSCYAIGLGAILTPIGEPLSTIATSKLNADFFYLFHLLGAHVILGVIAFGILTALIIKPKRRIAEKSAQKTAETYVSIIVRGCKIYLFIIALTLLGAGFERFINEYLLHVSPAILFWMNMISAVLDNATLASAEISPLMTEPTIKAISLGLIVSGGMLIPGNIPNIIVASKLNISSKEWARFAVPIGLIGMLVYYFIIQQNGFI